MPCSAWNAREACCCRCGCSSIWLTAGMTDVSPISRSRCAGEEVGHADGAHPAVREELLERLVRVHVTVAGGQRPVDEVQVQVVQTELLQRGVERAERRVVPLVAVPELGGDEDVVAGHAGGGDGLAGALLVAVDRRCVDAAVPGLQRGGDRLLRLVVRHLPDTEAQLGHLHAVVEDDRGDLAAHELLILRLSVKVVLPSSTSTASDAFLTPEFVSGAGSAACLARFREPVGNVFHAAAGNLTSGTARRPRSRKRFRWPCASASATGSAARAPP